MILDIKTCIGGMGLVSRGGAGNEGVYMKKVYAVIFAALLFAGAGAGAYGQNVTITVQRAKSQVYAGFKERIYIDGKSKLSLSNGGSGEISLPAGEHTIHAELYTITTQKLQFNARSGLTFVVTPHSLDNFVIEQQGGGGQAAAAQAAGNALQAFDTQPNTSDAHQSAALPPAGSVEGTLLRAAIAVMNKITTESRVAIVNISAPDPEVSEFIAGELEYIMVDKGFTLIDRVKLDEIRKEQALQMSGEVDDSQAVSIGKIAGADVIITGAVTGSGNLRRLRLRALSTESGRVLAVASEKY